MLVVSLVLQLIVLSITIFFVEGSLRIHVGALFGLTVLLLALLIYFFSMGGADATQDEKDKARKARKQKQEEIKAKYVQEKEKTL